MNLVKNTASEQSIIIQSALKQAVSNALEKKRRLGQYAVVWENNQLSYKGNDAPEVTPNK